jgi:hypothetical protein
MYEVGQVLFVVLNKRPQIIPVQVIEQVVRRSLQGEEIQYSVNVPTKDGDKTFELSGLDGVVYTSIDEVQEAMLTNAKSTILKMTQKASAIAKNRFDNEQSEDSVPAVNISQGNGEAMKITLDDGVVANVILPDGIVGDSL